MAATGGLSLFNALVLICVCVGMKRPALILPVILSVLLWQLQDTLRRTFQSH